MVEVELSDTFGQHAGEERIRENLIHGHNKIHNV